MPHPTFYNLPDEKKEQIILSAVEEFSEKGYLKTSIAKIIEKADIPRGSFYQYFEDKDDLYRYLIMDVVGKRKHSYSSLPLNEDLSFIEFIRGLFEGGLKFYRDFPELAAIATDFMGLRDSALKERILGDSQQQSDLFFTAFINRRKEAGEIDGSIDNEMLLYFINTINQTFASYFLNKGMHYENEHLMRKVDSLLSILRNGILKKGAVIQ